MATHARHLQHVKNAQPGPIRKSPEQQVDAIGSDLYSLSKYIRRVLASRAWGEVATLLLGETLPIAPLPRPSRRWR
jgi:hypothetical protein